MHYPHQSRSLSLVRPILEYASAVWDPHSQNNLKHLKESRDRQHDFAQIVIPGNQDLSQNFYKNYVGKPFKREENTKESPLYIKMEQHHRHPTRSIYQTQSTRCSGKHNSQFLQIRHSSNAFGIIFPNYSKYRQILFQATQNNNFKKRDVPEGHYLPVCQQKQKTT